MSVKETHVRRSCRTCNGGRHRGLLWLGGRDYVECPDCNGTGIFELVERLDVPTRHSIIIPDRRLAVASYNREEP